MADSERARQLLELVEGDDLTDYQRGYVDGFDAPANAALRAAQPSAEPGLEVRALENAWAGHWLDVQRGPRPLRLFHTCGPSCSAGLARHYAAALTPTPDHDRLTEARDEATYWRRQAIEAQGREGA